MSKWCYKHISSLDYFDKYLIVLSAIRSSIFIPSFATVIGAPGGMTSASITFAFSTHY